jgi:hypothetical protein
MCMFSFDPQINHGSRNYDRFWTHRNEVQKSNLSKVEKLLNDRVTSDTEICLIPKFKYAYCLKQVPSSPRKLFLRLLRNGIHIP